MKTTFETGATTHAVNDLVLFTDNTRKLAELRDNIYKRWATNTVPKYAHEFTMEDDFTSLLIASIAQYQKEFGHEQSRHISFFQNMDKNMRAQGWEFCKLYANDFENWKQENGY